MAIKKCSHIFYFRFLPKEELTVWSSTTFRVPQFLRRLRQRQRQESIIDTFWLQFSGLLCGQLRSLCCEFCSRQLRPCPCIHVRKWSRRIVYLPLSPASAQSSAQEERNPWVQFVCDSTHLPIIGYSSIRSSRRPGIGRRNLLHSSKSSASSRFHFQSTLLKKEMDNELTIFFSSDLEEHSHHKKLKKKSDLLSSNGSVRRYSARIRRCGGQFFFCLYWVIDWELLIAVIIF